jgi:hypothetical protein
MRRRIVTLLLLGPLLITACAKYRPQPPVQPFQPYDDFIAAVQGAQFTDFSGKPGSAVESAAAFEEMKQHILRLYAGVHPRNSFVGADRQLVDCVPIEQQPGLRPPGSTPLSLSRDAPRQGIGPTVRKGASRDRLPGRRRSEDITLKAGRRDVSGRVMFCESGTIPMRRITLLEITAYRTLASFLAKSEGEREQIDPNAPADNADHYYARGRQFVASLGGDSWLNVWSPRVNSGHMSLSQQWFVAGEGDSKQTIEGGWQVYPGKYKIDQAALFIYHTTKGYASGSGCYNLDCSAFVQVANNIYLGAGFTNYSTAGGTQWGFNLQWKRNTDGNWWLFYKGPGNYIAVGYYPARLYERGAMASSAAKIAYGGETTGKPSALEMGSGQLANQNWQKAAFQNFAFYIDANGVSQWADLTKEEPDAECYTADLHNIFGSWGTYLFFGGPKCH